VGRGALKVGLFPLAILLRLLLAGILGLIHPGSARAAAPAEVRATAKVPAAASVPVVPKAPAAPPPAPATPCDVALAYLHAHGNPIFTMVCHPGGLPSGIAAVTCWNVTALGVSCPGVGIVVISKPTCVISYENEASNSWLDFSTLTAGAINGRSRHDGSGRTVDPFGECG
jgi:hypothetical protein